MYYLYNFLENCCNNNYSHRLTVMVQYTIRTYYPADKLWTHFNGLWYFIIPILFYGRDVTVHFYRFWPINDRHIYYSECCERCLFVCITLFVQGWENCFERVLPYIPNQSNGRVRNTLLQRRDVWWTDCWKLKESYFTYPTSGKEGWPEGG